LSHAPDMEIVRSEAFEHYDVLLLCLDFSDQTLEWARQRYAKERTAVLVFRNDTVKQPLPESWRRLLVADFLDIEALRQEFLDFLDTWPRQRIYNGRSFNDVFRQASGASIWWTGIADQRAPEFYERDIFLNLKILWVFDRVLQTISPRQVAIDVARPDLAKALEHRCKVAGCLCDFGPNSARPIGDPWRGRWKWLIRSLLRQFLLPAFFLAQAAFARVLAKTRLPSPKQRRIPAVVFGSTLYRYYRIEGGQIFMDSWCDVVETLGKREPAVRPCFIAHCERGFQGYRPIWLLGHTAWRLLRTLENAVPVPARYPSLGAWMKSIPNQVASVFRYYLRVEPDKAFRQSFRFAGTDIACFYLPLLRRRVRAISMADQSTAAHVAALRAMGNIRALVTYDEVYWASNYIAAAKELGIPTVAVQHGSIHPLHLEYLFPKGQVEQGIVPQYFAVYGAYAKELLSQIGRFPADRIWVTGGNRFDHWAQHHPDQALARKRLGLPEKKRIVFFATQHYHWFLKVARSLFSILHGEERYWVCVKTHPYDVPLDVYRKIAEETGLVNVSFFADQFENLLTASDVLISGSSTAMLEAILARKIVICANYTNEPDWYPFVADGGAIGARSDAELRLALERAFSEKACNELKAEQREFLRRHMGPAAEGRSAATLAEKIVGIINREPGIS